MREGMTLTEWLGTFEAHMVLGFAARYASGRGTGGSQMCMDDMARNLVPHVGANTAQCIARDLGQEYGIRPAFADWEPLREGYEPRAELGLYDACVARLAELGDIRGIEWRRAR